MVLPEPVSPATTTTWWSRIAASSSSRRRGDRELLGVGDLLGTAARRRSTRCRRGREVAVQPRQRRLVLGMAARAVQPPREAVRVEQRQLLQAVTKLGERHDLPGYEDTAASPRAHVRALRVHGANGAGDVHGDGGGAGGAARGTARRRGRRRWWGRRRRAAGSSASRRRWRSRRAGRRSSSATRTRASCRPSGPTAQFKFAFGFQSTRGEARPVRRRSAASRPTARATSTCSTPRTSASRSSTSPTAPTSRSSATARSSTCSAATRRVDRRRAQRVGPRGRAGARPAAGRLRRRPGQRARRALRPGPDDADADRRAVVLAGGVDLSAPQGIALNPAGTRVYVADDDHHRVVVLRRRRRWTQVGAVGTLGTGPGPAAEPLRRGGRLPRPQPPVRRRQPQQPRRRLRRRVARLPRDARRAGLRAGHREHGDRPLGGRADRHAGRRRRRRRHRQRPDAGLRRQQRDPLDLGRQRPRAGLLHAAGGRGLRARRDDRGRRLLRRADRADRARRHVGRAARPGQRLDRLRDRGQQPGAVRPARTTSPTTRAGNLWVADYGNDRVQEIGPDGKVIAMVAGRRARWASRPRRAAASTSRGRGTASSSGSTADGDARPRSATGLAHPAAVAVAPDGTRVRRRRHDACARSPTARSSPAPGGGTTWDHPSGLGFGPDGDALRRRAAAGHGRRRARRQRAERGERRRGRRSPTEGAGPGQVVDPGGLAVSADGGTVLVADTGGDRVVRLDADGHAPPARGELTVSVAGGIDRGTVVSDLPGIACVSDCEQHYGTGRTVTLTARPRAGSVIAGWTGVVLGHRADVRGEHGRRPPGRRDLRAHAAAAGRRGARAEARRARAQAEARAGRPAVGPALDTHTLRTARRAEPAQAPSGRAGRPARPRRCGSRARRRSPCACCRPAGPARRLVLRVADAQEPQGPAPARTSSGRPGAKTYKPTTRTIAFRVSSSFGARAARSGAASYQLSVTAVDAEGNRSGPRTVSFKVPG